ncbi:MAG TPA: hypothetical protein V6D23_09920 [Candidatus Obscuribacterales bacterium]
MNEIFDQFFNTLTSLNASLPLGTIGMVLLALVVTVGVLFLIVRKLPEQPNPLRFVKEIAEKYRYSFHPPQGRIPATDPRRGVFEKSINSPGEFADALAQVGGLARDHYHNPLAEIAGQYFATGRLDNATDYPIVTGQLQGVPFLFGVHFTPGGRSDTDYTSFYLDLARSPKFAAESFDAPASRQAFNELAKRLKQQQATVRQTESWTLCDFVWVPTSIEEWENRFFSVETLAALLKGEPLVSEAQER